MLKRRYVHQCIFIDSCILLSVFMCTAPLPLLLLRLIVLFLWASAPSLSNELPSRYQVLQPHKKNSLSFFLSKNALYNPHELQAVSPKHTNTPAEFPDKTRALVMEDPFCRFPSLSCFDDGPLHIDPLWRLFVIPWTITVKPGAALFPTRRSSQRGFRHTISHGYSTIAGSAETYGVRVNVPFYLQTLSIAYLSVWKG